MKFSKISNNKFIKVFLKKNVHVFPGEILDVAPESVLKVILEEARNLWHYFHEHKINLRRSFCKNHYKS